MESILEAKETDVTRSIREVRAMAACVIHDKGTCVDSTHGLASCSESSLRTVESNPYRPCKSSETDSP